MLSPIGLSAVSELSVARITSMMMGAWFLATAYSEVLAAQLAKISSVDPADADNRLAMAAGYTELFELMLWIGLGAAAVALLATPLMNRGIRGASRSAIDAAS